MILNDSTMAECWYAALDAEFGLRLVLADPKDATRIISEFYRVRKDLADPRLQNISICRPEGGKELWMVQQGVDMSEGPNEERTING